MPVDHRIRDTIAARGRVPMGGVPGRIPDRDIAAIRERTHRGDRRRLCGIAARRCRLDEGLCPFHEVSVFSCAAGPRVVSLLRLRRGGDVFSFLQKQEHITFVEAVEQMADRSVTASTMRAGGAAIAVNQGTRARLVATEHRGAVLCRTVADPGCAEGAGLP